MQIEQWTAQNIPTQSGRTFLVTGAASGLGFITALELARRGAHVIMTARDQARGAAARGVIRSQVRHARVELRLLDLADLDMVRSFAAQIDAEGRPIDVLINSAAVMMPPRSLTRQGLELQFGVNHIAHFALTMLLLERLKAGRDARVVTVSCREHERGAIHFDDLTGAAAYSGRRFYAQSKLANALFALELDGRLREAGVAVKSIAAIPGYSATNLQRSGPTGLMYLAFLIGNQLVAQSARSGALSLLYAATAPTVAGGHFIGQKAGSETSAYPTVVRPAQAALDSALAKRLWTVSERLAGVPGIINVAPPRTERQRLTAAKFLIARPLAGSNA